MTSPMMHMMNLSVLRQAQQALENIAAQHGLSVAAEMDHEQDFWKIRFFKKPAEPPEVRALKGFLNKWREEHDLSPSQMVEALQAAVDHYKPEQKL